MTRVSSAKSSGVADISAGDPSPLDASLEEQPLFGHAAETAFEKPRRALFAQVAGPYAFSPSPQQSAAPTPTIVEPPELKGIAPELDRMRWSEAKRTAEGMEVLPSPEDRNSISSLTIMSTEEA